MTTSTKKVSLNAAMKLRDLGFDMTVGNYYEKTSHNDSFSRYELCKGRFCNDDEESGWASPTLATTMDLLRKRKGVEIWIVPNNLCSVAKGYHWCAATRSTAECIGIRKSGDAATHPHAAEQAIEEVLSVLIQ